MIRAFSKIIFFLFILNCIQFAQNGPIKEIILSEGSYYNTNLKDESGFPEIKLALTLNRSELIIKANVKDNHFKDGDRSWRYGDGFFVNFVTPFNNGTDSSNKFYSFGFSIQDGKPVAFVVNKDGKYFPKISSPPVPEIKINNSLKTADYFIKIPWENIYPFNPLRDSLAGINIVYISQNDDRSRKINMLIYDNYDTESTNFRKYIPVRFRQSDKSRLQFSFAPKPKLVIKSPLIISYFVFSPGIVNSDFKVRIFKNQSLLNSHDFSTPLISGKDNFRDKIDLMMIPGLYKISISLNDSLIHNDNFLIYDSSFISKSKKEIDLLASDDNAASSLSVTTLYYQLNIIENEIASFDERKNLEELQNQIETFTSLLKIFMKDKTIFNKEGYLLAAFKSQIDLSPQPFSIMLPANFNPRQKHNLLFALHGSGVDEVEYIKYAAKMFAQNNFILVAPRGRGLSDWYTGTTEKDVVDLIKNIKSVFKIDKSFLYGFSMGGYGAWRFGLLYPELFDAAIVASGIPFNPRDEKHEYDMNNIIKKEKKLAYLVLHGTNDNSLDISYTDSFIKKLQALNYDITYKRIEGAGHGNYESKEIIQKWLQKFIDK